ncbi:MAG TPA: DsbA family protein, partial [Ramlibacter sp.]
DLHTKVFDAIHKQHAELTLVGPMAHWAATQGIDPQKFTDMYNSFAVSAKARRAVEIQDAYKVEGVPAFGIAGRWYTDPTLTAGNDGFLHVADFLIAKARSTR